ncbi:MAG: hypothetical protein JF597_23090 [Streptomyces sp.]|uniref:hypothetical protein n=1 Tax=Streptomyces sp. TaxID=1931 RepID=UPI0025D17163|nr:hypothetical protein [Streptomyces sp.]MBW8796375.1 hypothetical protein [Streptomyces sp.]
MTLAVIAAGAALVVGAAFAGWTLGLGTRDRAVTVNTALVIYTCLVTAVAAIVALWAYRAATGRPALDIEITFNFSFPNEPVFAAVHDEDDITGWRKLESFKQTWATVTLNNASAYAAKNPGVRIGLEGLGSLGPQEGWQTVTFVSSVGITAIQWDGGTDSIVHGQWSRALPTLDFSDVRELVPGETALVVTIVADGVEPLVKRLPVRVLDQEEYGAYTEQRAQQVTLD